MQNSGAKEIIDQLVQQRQLAAQAPRDLVKVVKVMRHPVTHPPRTVATIHLENGATYDLTQDEWGKRNYDLNFATSAKGDELKCVYPPGPGQRLILVGSQAGIKGLS